LKNWLFRKVPSSVTPGHWLEVIETGSGPTVFFVHGASGSPHNFRQQLKSLSADYRCVAMALRGHGASTWPGHSDIDDYYQDVEDVMGTLPPRFALVAHSFGGYLGARIAVTHPDRVVVLGLLNTAGHIPRGVTYRLLQLFCPRAGIANTILPNQVTSDAVVSRNLVNHTLKQWDCWDAYPAIKIPTLVVLGELDPLIPARLTRKAADLLPDTELETSVGGHVTMWERPAKVNRWLRRLLEKANW
jgi:long-chain acyl-CoA synthetase